MADGTQERIAAYYRHKQRSSRRWRFLIGLTAALFLAVLAGNVLFPRLVLGDDAMAPALPEGATVPFSVFRAGVPVPFGINVPDNRFGKPRALRRGQLVVVVNPNSPPSSLVGNAFRFALRMASFGFYRPDSQRLVLRRVLASGGESVSIRQKQIYLDNQPFVPTWNVGFGTDAPLPGKVSGRDNLAEVVIPADQVFLLNDNWNVVNDSRESGPVPLYKIRGLVRDPP